MTSRDGVTGEGLTFAAYAERIGKSRPYVSKLVALGRIRPPALTPDRKIIPDLADQQIADGADPAKGPNGAPAAMAMLPLGAEGSYAQERARLTKAQAERAELELAARRGELLDRATLAGTLSPAIRELRDGILGVPRDIVLDPVQAADCETALERVLTEFSARALTLAVETEPDAAAAAEG